MATTRLPADFQDFLKLLNLHHVDYLLIGGYAVCYHGHYRTTNDIDFWIAVNPENARKMAQLLRDFGFNMSEVSEELFLQKGRIIRMGVEPTRIEILTEISGCDFGDCFRRRVEGVLDGVPVHIMSLPDLIQNKIKSGRLKDLDDVRHLA
jgi:hypothetical protein